jgi:hypothetical protein
LDSFIARGARESLQKRGPGIARAHSFREFVEPEGAATQIHDVVVLFEMGFQIGGNRV